MSDATYMKDYLSYKIMRETGVSAPLTSYVSLSINGEKKRSLSCCGRYK